MKIFITGAATEFGLVATRYLQRNGHQIFGLCSNQERAEKVKKTGATPVLADATNHEQLVEVLKKYAPEVVLNLQTQPANTLLHDGPDWKDYDYLIPATTRALLIALEKFKVEFLVHTSYAFLYGNARDASEETPLSVPSGEPDFEAAIKAEEMVKNSGQPYCILRLGYLYGPQSQDLALYVKSFKLGRPYYSGPPEHLSNWVRFEDAAQAVELAAQRKPKGEVFNIVDGTPVSFGDFIDFFAVKQGRSRPVHLPMWGTPMFRLIIKHQQTELLKIITTVKNDKAKAKLGWEPAYPDYKKGITQIINLWRENKVVL